MSATGVLSTPHFEMALYKCLRIMPGKLLVSKTNLHVKGQ